VVADAVTAVGVLVVARVERRGREPPMFDSDIDTTSCAASAGCGMGSMLITVNVGRKAAQSTQLRTVDICMSSSANKSLDPGSRTDR